MGNTSVTSSSPNGGPHRSYPSGFKPMNKAIQQRIHSNKSTYNMKVIIRGDRQTGKSCLFHRLEGGGFVKEHLSTAQIEITKVLWQYKTSDEMVTLEIWDIVDSAIIPTINADTDEPHILQKNTLPLDASTVDVYKGAHAVVFMVDPTRKWTLDYVKEHIRSVPSNIDCLVVFGKKDLHHIWTLSKNEIKEFMSSQATFVRHFEVSLLDCFGMKELHSFFNVPFLRMKCKSLEKELQRTKREFEQSKVELDVNIHHQRYSDFQMRLQLMREQRKKKKFHQRLKVKSHSMMNNVQNHSPMNIIENQPVLRVKQTIFSSADLQLVQEQIKKEEQKKEEQKKEEQKKEEQKKEQTIREKEKIEIEINSEQENIETFVADGGNISSDFFNEENKLKDNETNEEIVKDMNSVIIDNNSNSCAPTQEMIGFPSEDENEIIDEVKEDIGSNHTFSGISDGQSMNRQSLMTFETNEVQITDSDEYEDDLLFNMTSKVKEELTEEQHSQLNDENIVSDDVSKISDVEKESNISEIEINVSLKEQQSLDEIFKNFALQKQKKMDEKIGKQEIEEINVEMDVESDENERKRKKQHRKKHRSKKKKKKKKKKHKTYKKDKIDDIQSFDSD